MKKTLLALLFIALPVHGSEPLALQYDPDSLTYTCPVLCTSPSAAASTPGSCPGIGTTVSRLATTSGVASTTVTSVNTDSPFNAIAVGDAIQFEGTNTTSAPALRRVTAVASANSITVDSNVTIATAGAGFRWWKLTAGTGTDDGWFAWPATGNGEVLLSFNQISDTGGVDFKVEGRMVTGGVPTLPVTIAGPTNVATATTLGARAAFSQEYLDQLRFCFKITTADDDVVTIGATTDDIDFTEDPGGVPVACRAVVASGLYATGSSLCTAVAAAMNTANICAGPTSPANTYSCSYAVGTDKVTIARSAGAKTFDLPWQTGPNTATSAKTNLGYDNVDDTGALTYTGDSALGLDAANEIELVTVLVNKR